MKKRSHVSDELETLQTNPVKVIRLKCRDCTNNQISEIDNCTATRCPLHPFRFGKNPYRTTRSLTDEQRQEMANRLSKARDAKTTTASAKE